MGKFADVMQCNTESSGKSYEKGLSRKCRVEEFY